jgi:hypothetical protein
MWGSVHLFFWLFYFLGFPYMPLNTCYTFLYHLDAAVALWATVTVHLLRDPNHHARLSPHLSVVPIPSLQLETTKRLSLRDHSSSSQKIDKFTD